MKKTTKLLTSCATFLLVGIASALAQTNIEQISLGETRKEVAVTIYNKDLALVREVRDLNFQKGVNHFALRDVSGKIKPETAIMTTKDNVKLYVIEQNFNFDLLTPEALIKKYVGKEVTIVKQNTDNSETSEKATILSYTSGLVLKYNDRIEIDLPTNARIKFDSVPQNLRDRPTLVTDIMSEEAGTKEVNIAYLSGGFHWKADYVAELNENENNLSLKGWITLSNDSGTSYENAKLQLVAGDINRVQNDMHRMRSLKYAKSDSPMMSEEKIHEESFMDYHLYTLPQPTTINNNQIKQIALMGADNIPVKKHYIVETSYQNIFFNSEDGLDQPLTVGVYFDFKNDKDSNLGIPLPKGILRAYKPDSKGNVLFVGEDNINHIADKETVRLKFGNAFDIKVYVKTLEKVKVQSGLFSKTAYDTTNEFKVQNAKNEPVEVEIPVRFYEDWEILQESTQHEKPNANMAIWKVKVAPKSETIINFKARITN